MLRQRKMYIEVRFKFRLQTSAPQATSWPSSGTERRTNASLAQCAPVVALQQAERFVPNGCALKSEVPEFSFTPSTPKFKKYILKTFQREMYEGDSENWYGIIIYSPE